jgi:mono/diheme cytochrome c family protein
MAVVRRALVGAIVAIFGIVGILGTGYSAGAKPGSRHDAQKLAEALKKCKKDRSKSKRKKCEKTARARYRSKTKRAGKGIGTTTGMATTIGTTTATATATGMGAATATATGTTTAAVTATGTGATGMGTATGGTTGGTATTTGTPFVPQMARLSVHVVGAGPRNEEAWPISIQQLGGCTNEPCRLETHGTRPVELAPGSYEVAALGDPKGPAASTTVTLGEGQELEVTLVGAKPIPSGVSVVNVIGTETLGHKISFAGTISEPQGVSELIAQVERERQEPMWGIQCLGYGNVGTLELIFRRSAQGQPVAKAIEYGIDVCGSLEVSLEGGMLGDGLQPIAHGGALGLLAAKLLGVEVPGEAPRHRSEAEELERAHHASNMPSSTLVATGRTLFAGTCAACHGSMGQGTVAAPPLTEPSQTRGQSVGGVMEQLISPVGGGMPNFRNNLSVEEKEALGAYVCVDITMKCEQAH